MVDGKSGTTPTIELDLSEFGQLTPAEVVWRSLDAYSPNLPCDTYECADRLWCIQRRICKREQEMEDQVDL